MAKQGVKGLIDQECADLPRKLFGGMPPFIGVGHCFQPREEVIHLSQFTELQVPEECYRGRRVLTSSNNEKTFNY